MSIELTMPRLSDTMEAGTIIKWNVKEGDKVSSGQVVADVETDKATMEMQVFDDGTIAKLLVKEGQQVPIGSVIAVIAEVGEDPKSVKAPASTASKSSTNAAGEKTQAAKTPATGGAGSSNQTGVTTAAPPAAPDAGDDPELDEASHEHGGNGRVRVSPIARRMAEDAGLDLTNIHGSGPGGRVIKRDVQSAMQSAPKAPASTAASKTRITMPLGAGGLEARTIQLSGMRQTIAKRLVESKSTIPHYQVTTRFNLDPLLDLRKTLNAQLESQGVKLSVNDFLVRACALAIHHHPEFNSTFNGDSITIKADVNVGVAISLPRERGGGLVVGTIRNADRKGLRLISEETRGLAEKARGRGLSVEDMADSTFTISNLGMYGVDNFTAIINPPNVAILAVGAGVETPVVRNGSIVVGHEMAATLSLDHRVIDGAMAAEYLQTLKQLIENPATLLV